MGDVDRVTMVTQKMHGADSSRHAAITASGGSGLPNTSAGLVVVGPGRPPAPGPLVGVVAVLLAGELWLVLAGDRTALENPLESPLE